MNANRTKDILLVEDNPNDVELTLRALKKHNLSSRLQVVRDGEEALEFLFCEGKFSLRDKTDLPRFILLDLKLPKVTGLEVLERVKSDDLLKMIPVVILTTSREEKDMLQSYQTGANSYIVKPVDYNKFVDSVAEIGQYWLLVNEIPQK